MQRSTFLLLREDEVVFYERLFHMGDTLKSGILSSQTIQKLMALSKLPNDTLAKIWALAANKKWELNKDDFFVACRAVALAQKGVPVTNENLMQVRDVALPYFEGISLPQAQNIPVAQPVLQQEVKPMAIQAQQDGDGWAISIREGQKYMEVCDKLYFSQRSFLRRRMLTMIILSVGPKQSSSLSNRA